MDFEKIIQAEISGEPPEALYKNHNSCLIIKLASMCKHLTKENVELQKIVDYGLGERDLIDDSQPLP